MKRVLVLNFFPAFHPPTSGGELRYYHFYEELSKVMDVTLLSPTYSHHEAEVVVHHDHYREYRIPKQNVHDQLHMDLDKEDVGMEISALVCALSADYANAYHDKYLELYNDADIIIHEFPYMLNYDLFFGLDKKPRIYNSHNHESELVKQTWKGKGAEKYIKLLGDMEKKLVQQADLVFATAAKEVENFVTIYGADPSKVLLAPNGIIPGDLMRETRAASSSDKKTAFFIGSAHPPNLEAVEYILNSLAPSCPEFEFVIAGACCNSFVQPTSSNVKLLGLIDDAKRHELFATSDIAINPMFSGAGTNLKTLEYMSAGIPLVSTEFGVRGLDLDNHSHFLQAEKDTFSEVLHAIIQMNPLELDQIAKNGQEYIQSRYSWESIVSDVLPYIMNVTDGDFSNKFPNILVLNDYGVAAPTAGGEIRINRLYSAMSRNYQVNLLCLGGQDNLQRDFITARFVQISVPKTNEHKMEDTKINGKHWISAADIVNAYMIKENELLKRIYDCLYKAADLIIASHPYMMNIVDNPLDKPFIYESHNTEFTLKEDLLKGHPLYDELIREVYSVERKAVNSSRLIVSVSDTDHASLQILKKEPLDPTKIFTIKNGVDIKHEKYNTEPVKAVFSGYPSIVFVGSSHPPNIESAKFIVERLAPQISAYFILIGSVCDALSSDLPDNVIFLGRISDIQKDFVMQMADVALNPMMGGSGSNLKLADYMSHSLPVITTSIGKRGYEIVDGEHAVICDLDDFKDRIVELLAKPEMRDEIGKKAFAYVRHTLDWKVLAREFDALIQKELFGRSRKKILFITYRYTEPPLGGAETYLLKVIEQLDQNDDYSIDVVTMDIGSLYNKHHFSIEYTTDIDFNDSNYRNTTVYKFPVTAINDNIKYENSRKLFELWMKESCSLSLYFKEHYTFPILLGGWHYPEKQEEGYSVWSSSESYLYIGESKTVCIRAESPTKRMLTIKSAEGAVVYQQKVAGSFRIELSQLETTMLALSIDAYYVEGQDPRGLGLRVNEITYDLGSKGNSVLKLDYNYKDFLKEKAYEPFIDQLIAQAEHRESQWDELFQTTRGPASEEMKSWLENHIQDADLVFGHSVPFQTFVTASDFASKYNKPLMLLPHFHMDDEYYHWKSFYDSMRKADRVIAAPTASIPIFYDKIGAITEALPGGAIDPSEYEHIDSSDFKKKYESNLPFVLVLGRKSRSKNYHWVMEAIEKVNREVPKCNLVIIGKDEDGDPIHQDHVYYLGALEREEVMGALKECAMLVTMSDSESFGIVILESWMLKKPVVVNESCPAFTELVEDGENGRLANKENLHDQIIDILDHPLKSSKMGENGFNKVSSSYTWNSISSRLNQIFKDLTTKA
ncbi:glycosyltransferase family 4 protein [Paenibacillus sp. D9]|uniref:glycosyltransferase family 4 protein n=1 Tax=Paenibacillus sp. D9 TaxID=665792 RepID=UPI0006769CC2|nr:glycosyltransferase family 4 protein [Paenibacillus sp. D9]